MDYQYYQDYPIQIYKGNAFLKSNKKSKRVIAFDLDETLGSFSDLELLWKLLRNIPNININFNELMDIYPEFLRYGILNILDFLYKKKISGDCDKIYIYTNNQCSADWPNIIAKYFDYKLKTDSPLFDKIICAFKINETRVELSRRTHEKTHGDFIRCTLLPKKTEICFLDNSAFDGMIHNNIYYIQPPSYYHRLSHKTIIDRFIFSKIAESISDKQKLVLYKTAWGTFPNIGIEFNDALNEKDIIISQRIMYHIKEFFFLGKKKKLTRKIKQHNSKKTRKKLFGQVVVSN
jgi:hypothetical protein